MSKFTADPPAMLQKARELESLAGEYNSIRARLLDTASSMGAAYQSADNITYVNQITELCSHLSDVVNKMNNAAQVLTADANGYTQTESDNTSAASKLPTGEF